MQFALYELARNQEVQNKLREEIKRVSAKHKGELTYEAVMSEMEYLGRVVDGKKEKKIYIQLFKINIQCKYSVAETLRKYPPGFVLGRMCTRDFRIPDSNVTIEKGTNVVIPVFGMHKDERYFPDPEKFDPDRFTEEQKATRHNYAYLPFGEGPRNCIGKVFIFLLTK